jgi:hypothetical protein
LPSTSTTTTPYKDKSHHNLDDDSYVYINNPVSSGFHHPRMHVDTVLFHNHMTPSVCARKILYSKHPGRNTSTWLLALCLLHGQQAQQNFIVPTLKSPYAR